MTVISGWWYMKPIVFNIWAHLAQPEYFTLISIDCFVARSLETKRKLYQQIIESLGKLGIPPHCCPIVCFK
ncbi:tautomerase family protein [Acinetobacter variabilis]|uniref:tautomerase family protein n=1 Tax=Acinetobacter variabilis TaxID=70346 RepID=UPI0028A59741|nr:tautomerase family protein [Acinetobacter variabilis]